MPPWARPQRWAVMPDDPNSAIAEIDWEQTGGREGQMWRTEIVSKMWCDRENFFTTAALRCWLNDDIFHECEYRDSVERKLV